MEEYNKERLDMLVKEAYREWEEARDYFDNVCENELIDYAAFALEAARRRLSYMTCKRNMAE